MKRVCQPVTHPGLYNKMHLDKQFPDEDSSLTIIDFLHQTGKEDHREEIIAGLSSAKKYISSKFFYDARGSKLFEEITRLPEYYLTRTEKSILKNIASRIGRGLKDVDIVELGSGDCSKISILFDAVDGKGMDSVRYIPVDVSRPAIEKSANVLLNSFPGLKIRGAVADFTQQLKLIPQREKRLFCFFGSTIGNFQREQAVQFIGSLSGIMKSGDRLLLGMDMVKRKDLLEDAYNDSRGVTAAFNRNVLNVVNNLIHSDFDSADFEHVAFFNDKRSRIEMHLKALKDLSVSSPCMSAKIAVKQGETIHTENCHKFTDRFIDEIALASGLIIEDRFTDENKWFSVVQFCKRENGSR